MIQQSLEIGPIHEFLPGMMKLGLGLHGDRIESIDTEFGYLSKKLVETANEKSVIEAQIRLSRIDPENAPIVDFLITTAIEEATATIIPERAIWIRDITVQVCELNSAIRYLAMMAKRMQLDALVQVLLRHREDLMDLIELLTGSRFGYDYIVPGGVRFDLSHGFSERLERWIKNFNQDYLRIEAMFYWTSYHENYLKQIGGVVDTGNLGFVSRALKEETRLGPVSNVKSRLDFVLESTLKICSILASDVFASVEGEFRAPAPLTEKNELKKNDVKSEFQSIRGSWFLRLSLSKGLFIKNLEVITPSDQSIRALSEALLDESFDDLPLIVQSLNLSIAEIDK